MSKIIVVRHSKSAYPGDLLSSEGIAYAEGRKDEFASYHTVVTSEKQRAQQTAVALGHAAHGVDRRFNELELADVNEPTPHGYVLASHDRYPGLIIATADLMQEGILAVAIQAEGERALVVSHNLAISALFHTLSGEIDSFPNLGGLVLGVNDNHITLEDRV